MKIKIKNRFAGNVIFECELEAKFETEPFSVQMGAAVKVAYANKINLSRANLSRANLSRANLSVADLRGADLSHADLRDAYLSGADLSGANLIGADLSGANLRHADLSAANLSGAYLSGANLSGADLSGANLIGADLGCTEMYGTDLSAANFDYFKQDFIAEVLKLPNELIFLRNAIVQGRINGSVYVGKCACLAGTLAVAHGLKEFNGGRIMDIKLGGFTFRVNSESPREKWFLMIKEGDTPANNPASKLALEWLDEAIAIRDNILRISNKEQMESVK